jgi:hypothetical protein
MNDDDEIDGNNPAFAECEQYYQYSCQKIITLIASRDAALALAEQRAGALTVLDSILGNEIAEEVENWQVLEVARQIIHIALAALPD